MTQIETDSLWAPFHLQKALQYRQNSRVRVECHDRQTFMYVFLHTRKKAVVGSVGGIVFGVFGNQRVSLRKIKEDEELPYFGAGDHF